MMTFGHRNNLLIALGAISLTASLSEEKKEESVDPISFDYEDFGEKFRKVELDLNNFYIPSPDPILFPISKKKKNGKNWRKSSPFRKKNK